MNLAPKLNRLDRKGIVWIAAFPRSGSNWMRVFLYHLICIFGGHPGAAGSPSAAAITAIGSPSARIPGVQLT